MILCWANEVDSAIILSPVKKDTNQIDKALTSDDYLSFEVITYDAYKNIANPDASELNIDVFKPECTDETSGDCDS